MGYNKKILFFLFIVSGKHDEDWFMNDKKIAVIAQFGEAKHSANAMYSSVI